MFGMAKRSISLGWSLVNCNYDWDMYNQIASGLFLGLLPIKKNSFGTCFENTPESIIEFIHFSNPTRKLQLVVSVVEEDKELQPTSFLGVSPVTKKDWEETYGIKQHNLNMKDFEADVITKEAVETLFLMWEVIKNGGAVYIHCKAGRSRSAMMCAAFFGTFLIDENTSELYNFKDAADVIQCTRKQISIEADKEAKGKEILSAAKSEKEVLWQKEEKKSEASSLTLTERLNKLLITKTFKNEILKLDAVIQLRKYKEEFATSSRAQHIKVYLGLIYKAHSEQWFYTLFSPISPLNNLLSARPSLGSEIQNTEDQQRRNLLVYNMMSEALDYLCLKLACKRSDIENLLDNGPGKKFMAEMDDLQKGKELESRFVIV